MQTILVQVACILKAKMLFWPNYDWGQYFKRMTWYLTWWTKHLANRFKKKVNSPYNPYCGHFFSLCETCNCRFRSFSKITQVPNDSWTLWDCWKPIMCKIVYIVNVNRKYVLCSRQQLFSAKYEQISVGVSQTSRIQWLLDYLWSNWSFCSTKLKIFTENPFWGKKLLH